MITPDRSWIKDYVKLAFPENIEDMDLKSAILLLEKHIPTSLYKYRGFSTYSKDNFKDNTMWFNSSDQMNDPYDSGLTVNVKSYTDSLIPEMEFEKHEEALYELARTSEFNDSQLQEILNNFEEIKIGALKKLEEEIKTRQDRMVKESRKKTFISCFSEVNDSMLMWSHYTENHKGFCLKYNFKNTNNVGFDRKILHRLYPVLYRKKLFDMSKYLMAAREKGQEMNRTATIYAAMCKSLDWEYEKEWRIIDFPPNQNEGFIMPFYEAEAVYLGANMDAQHKFEIIEIAIQKKIDVYQMRLKDDEFKLIAEKVLSKKDLR